MSRVVIDTNVLVSSFFGGRPKDVLDLWRDGRLVICLSDEILAEYVEVVGRFGELTEEAHGFFRSVSDRKHVVMVRPTEKIRAAADPDDNMFLECAVAADADVIVSGDRHLLDLREFRGIPIVDPAAFLCSVEG